MMDETHTTTTTKTPKRRISFNQDMDNQHPTALYTQPRIQDYSPARTDKRPSEVYRLRISGRPVDKEKDSVVELAFHEGCHPKDGLNGWLLEDLIAVCLDRVQEHQKGPFRCRENALVATKLEEALLWSHRRRAARKAAGTSGTQKP